MKYIKPTDFLSVRELQAEYKKIEGDITDLLLNDASSNSAAELNKKLQQALNAATRYLAKVNDEFAKKELSTAFKEGKASVHEQPKLTAAEANAILSAQGFKYSDKAFSRHTYIELQTATENAGKGLKTRVNAIIEGLRKTGNDSVYNVQQAILKDIQDKGLMYVEYANGAKQTLDSYAAMAARSARIESTNIGAVGRALQAGTDLVRMTTMPQCCKLCGAYQDKVYSISGKDKRFPALFKTVLKSGYALPHPNCRHEFIPYFAEAEDPADVERMIKQSRIKYDKNGKLADVRTQRDIELYQSWQAGNRQRNTELLEYNKMREYYEANGIDAPYSTLAAFRRARRAQSENYRESRKEWAKEPASIADESKYGEKLQKPKGNNRAIIDSAKYEKHFEKIVGKTISRKVVVSAREILRENNRMNEETAIAITLNGERILKQHSPTLVIEVDMSELVKQPKDSVILLHNHPQNDTFTDRDLQFMQNKQIHTLIACTHDGKVYSLRINNGKPFDKYVMAWYNRYMDETQDKHKTMLKIAEQYEWEYKVYE